MRGFIPSVILLVNIAYSAAEYLPSDCWTNCSAECGGGTRECKGVELKCNVADCEWKKASCQKADVVFVLQNSLDQDEPHFWETKQFLIDVINGLGDCISNNLTRIGLVTFAEEAEKQWDIAELNTCKQIEAAISDLEQADTHGNNLTGGLTMGHYLFKKVDRKDATRLIIPISTWQSPLVREDAYHKINYIIGNAAIEVYPFYHYLGEGITADMVSCSCEELPDVKKCFLGSPYETCEVYVNKVVDAICNIRPRCIWSECSEICHQPGEDMGTRECCRTNGKKWHIPCHVQDCDVPDSCAEANVVFVLDSSNSIGERNWWRIKQFVSDVTLGLPVKKDEIHISAMGFSVKTKEAIALDNTTLDAYQSEKVVWDMEWQKKATNIYGGLECAKQAIEKSSRPSNQMIVILLTDGEENVNTDKTDIIADELKDDGVQIFAIKVRYTDTDELFEELVSEPKDQYFHHINDYDELPMIVDKIANKTCKAARGLLQRAVLP